MASADHEDSVERPILLTFALIPCLILIGFAGMNVYRQHFFAASKVHRFFWIRWAVLASCCQQLLAFIGYLSESIAATQIAWNTWIPTSLFCLTLIGIRVSESYISIRSISFTINKKHIWFAYGGWVTATVFDWIGSLCGWVGGLHILQAFFYATWKLVASICLSVVFYIVFQVRNATKKCYQQQVRRESLDVRFTPKNTNMATEIADNVMDGVKAIKLKAQNSLSLNAKYAIKKNDKFDFAETQQIKQLDEQQEDDQDQDQDTDNDQEQLKVIPVTTPKRGGDHDNDVNLKVNDNGSIVTKISTDNMTMKEKSLFKLAHSIDRMRNLLICLMILILVLFCDSMNQYIYFGKIATDPNLLNSYAHPSIAQIVVLYLSIWSFVQCIILIYTWIPKKMYKAQMKRRKSEHTNQRKTEETVTSNTATDPI